MISEETDEIIKELFKSLLTNHQKALENKKKAVISTLIILKGLAIYVTK